MPRRRSQSTARGLLLGVIAVVLGIALVFGLSVAASRGDVDLKNLGDREFDAGSARSKAEQIDEDGPILFPDAQGKTLDIYLQHVDGEWYAIAAGDRKCTLEWTGRDFRDPCTKKTFPADGSGLTRYQTRVSDGHVYVDFTEEVP
jgi:hypothetical protein